MSDAPAPDGPHDELLARLTGTPLGGERLSAVLAAYAPILDEIARLRELDLQDVHPAIVFEPTAAYRNARRP